jgi:hypothetical protein
MRAHDLAGSWRVAATSLLLCFASQAVVSAGATSSQQLSISGGAMVEASQKFIDFMKAQLVPEVELLIKSLEIPDISGKKSGFDYHVYRISVAKCDFSQAQISFKESQGLALSIPLNVQINGRWDYKLHSFPHVPKGSGSFTAKTSKSSISAVVVIGMKNGLPTAKSNNVGCSIKLSIKTSGSLLSWLYNLIVKAFQGSISKQICSASKTAVSTLISETLESRLQVLNLMVPVPLPPALSRPGFALAVDLKFSSAPQITSSSIAVAVFAATTNTAASSPPSPPPLPPALPIFASSAKHMLAAEVTSWGFNLAARVFQRQGFLLYTVLPAALPPSAPVQLNTNALAPFAPGMAAACPGCPVHITVNVTSPPRFGFNMGKIAVNATTTFAFAVERSGSSTGRNADAPANVVPAFVLTCPLAIGTNLSIVDQTFHVSFSYDSCALALASSQMGVVHPTLLGGLVKFLMSSWFVPQVNQAFAEGWTIPSAPLGGLSLTNSLLVVQDEAILIASDLKWSTTAQRGEGRQAAHNDGGVGGGEGGGSDEAVVRAAAKLRSSEDGDSAQAAPTCHMLPKTDFWCFWPKSNKNHSGTWCDEIAQVPSSSPAHCCALCIANSSAAAAAVAPPTARASGGGGGGLSCSAFAYNFRLKRCFLKARATEHVTGRAVNSTDTAGRLVFSL